MALAPDRYVAIDDAAEHSHQDEFRELWDAYGELEAERDQLAGQVGRVREEIAAARLHAECLLAVADDAREKGDRVRASRLERAGSEISEWSAKVGRVLDGEVPDAG